MEPAGPSTDATAFKSADAPTSHSSISPPPPSSGAGLTRTKRRRNTSTAPSDCCRTCRLRKVKCTGNPSNGGACANCSRLDLRCTFAESESAGEQDKVARTMPSRSLTEAGTVRKRAQRACSQCHAHKTKCSGDLPKCKRCETSDLVCEYIPAKRKFANVQFNVNSPSDDRDPPLLSTGQNDATPAPPPPADTSAISQLTRCSSGPSGSLALETSNFAKEASLVRKDILQTHIAAYYEHLYHLPCYGFFHPGKTQREIQEDRFHPGLAAAVCCVTSWIVNPSEAGRDFARKCNEQVDFHIFRNIGNFSEMSLTLLTLANLYNWIDGQYGKLWMYSAQAARLVHALQFNWDSETPSGPDGFIEQEIRRRLTWQTYITDRLLSGGFDEHTLCPDKSMFLRLPCDEHSFQENQPVNMERLDQKPGIGSKANTNLYAYHIRLVSIRHQILGTTKKYISGARGTPRRSRLEPSQVMEDVNKLQLKISGLVEVLPVSVRLSDQSVHFYFNSSERSSFVMLHTWIGQLYVDLYRFSLPDIREQASSELLRKLPLDFVTKSQKQAIAHAIGLSRFWEHMFLLLSTSTSSPIISMDYMISVCIFHSSLILLSARKHALYTNLNENSSAPLWRSEDVNDEVMKRLIKSNLEVLRPMAELMPRVRIFETELSKKVEEFAQWRDNEKGMVGLPAVPSDPNLLRLPGPHIILENALLKKNDEPPPRNAYQDQWAQQVQGMQIFPAEKQKEFCEGPPGLPFFLAQARGILPVSQSMTTQQPHLDMTAQPHQDVSRIVPVPNYTVMSENGHSQAPRMGISSNLGLQFPLSHGQNGMQLHTQYQEYGTPSTSTYQSNISSGYNLPSARYN